MYEKPQRKIALNRRVFMVQIIETDCCRWGISQSSLEDVFVRVVDADDGEMVITDDKSDA